MLIYFRFFGTYLIGKLQPKLEYSINMFFIKFFYPNLNNINNQEDLEEIEMKFFIKNSPVNLQNAIARTVDIMSNMSLIILKYILPFFLSIILCVYNLYLIHWKFCICSIIQIFCYVLVYIFSINNQEYIIEKDISANKKAITMSEMFNNMSLNKTLNLNNFCYERIEQDQKEETFFFEKFLIGDAKMDFFCTMVNIIYLNSVILIFLYFLKLKVILITKSPLFIMLNFLNLFYFTTFCSNLNLLIKNFKSISVLLNIINNEIIEKNQQKQQEIKKEKINQFELTGKISINKLTLQYDDKILIKDFSLNIVAGEKIAILGKSGLGKSTLLYHLIGLNKSPNNTIKYDNMDINDLNLKVLRDQISYISQKNMTFLGSIYDNILVGKLDASKDEIYEAAKKAELHEEIMALEEKYDSMVNILSGGQLQRVCLARFFLRSNEILLLDEAFSALDPENKQKIISSMMKYAGKKTILFITHNFDDLLTIKFDKLVLLESSHNWRVDLPAKIINNHEFYLQYLNNLSDNLKNFLI